MKPDRATIETEVQRDLDTMERKLESVAPGVLDVLQAYGDCEAAVRQAEEYLGNLQPAPMIVTSDRSVS